MFFFAEYLYLYPFLLNTVVSMGAESGGTGGRVPPVEKPEGDVPQK